MDLLDAPPPVDAQSLRPAERMRPDSLPRLRQLLLLLQSSSERPCREVNSMLGQPGRVGAGNHQTYSSLVSRQMPLSASVKSAFSSYVRSGCRGEPDGRTAVEGDSRGRESDAAFTPSPVDPVHRTSKIITQLESFVIYC